MTDLAVAMLNVDANQFTGGTGTTFGTAVTQAAAALGHVLGTANATKLFIAPEYYFSSMPAAFGSGSTPSPITRSAKHTVYDQLKAVSSQHSDIIIVAGSIFYRKTTGVFSKTQRGYNVCPVLLNGNFLHKYYKHDDDGNLGQSLAGANFTHKSTDPVFDTGGVRFGIEICADHSGSNVLRNWIGAHGGNRVDVHLYISATNAHFVSSIQAKKGGYLIHCDMNSHAGNKHMVARMDSTAVSFKDGKMVNPVSPVAPIYTSAALGNGSTVSVYQVTI